MIQKSPTEATVSAHRELSATLPFGDVANVAGADRGFLGSVRPGVIRAADDRVFWDLDLSLNVTFTHIDTNYRLTLHDGVLIYVERPIDDTADTTLTLTKRRMLGLLAGDTSSARIDIAGNADVLPSLLAVLEKGDPSFDIVTP